MLKLKLQYFCPPDAKNWLIGKDPDAGKDWRQEEKGTTEDEMVGWHHGLYGHEFEYIPVVDDGQVMACCSPQDHRELDTTELLNWETRNREAVLSQKGEGYCGDKKSSVPQSWMYQLLDKSWPNAPGTDLSPGKPCACLWGKHHHLKHFLSRLSLAKTWGSGQSELMPGNDVSSSIHSEKAMVPHSSTLAWKIPWMEEPGGL